MKKRKLDAEIDFNFSLWGIMSALKEYKLAWSLNNVLDIQLDKNEDIEIEFLNSQNLIISNYFFETEYSNIRLLKNKSVDQFSESSAFLLPELKRFDFLLIINGFEDTFTDQKLKENITTIQGIQYLQSFPVESFKSKENLIF